MVLGFETPPSWVFLYIPALLFSVGMWSHARFCHLGSDMFSVVYIRSGGRFVFTGLQVQVVVLVLFVWCLVAVLVLNWF